MIRIIRDTYGRPMQMLAEATQQVANGDLSVFVPAVHPAGKVDHLDAMIQDFNKMVAELGSIETPLAMIQNFADMLKDPALSEEERAEHVDTIARSSRRLNGLITNILKLNKLEKQNIQPVPEVYDLCARWWSVRSSLQTPHRSFLCKHKNQLTSPFLFSLQDLLIL